MVLCSIPLVAGINTERNRKTNVTNKWLKGWCYQCNISFLVHGAIFMATDLLESDGLHLSSKGKRILAHNEQGWFTGL